MPLLRLSADESEIEIKKKLTTIKDHVGKNGKYVLYLTAPWCGHCKALKPFLEELHEHLKKNKKQHFIVHIDDKHHSDLGEIININVEGYPTIAKGEGKEIKDLHNGPRDPVSLTKMHDTFFDKKPISGRKSKSKKTKQRKKTKQIKKRKSRKRKIKRKKNTRKNLTKKYI
jgi:thioredoxin 1